MKPTIFSAIARLRESALSYGYYLGRRDVRGMKGSFNRMNKAERDLRALCEEGIDG